MNDDTPTSTTEAVATGPSVPMQALLDRYANELAVMTQRALVAEALAAQVLAERDEPGQPVS